MSSCKISCTSFLGSEPFLDNLRISNLKLTHKARQFNSEDFLLFDYIVAMDKTNFQNIMKYTKEKLDNLQFSENFEKKKREYFNKNIEEIKDLCDSLDIDCTELNNDEIFELLLKPETIKIIKDRLFKNIKKHINKIAYDYFKCYSLYNEYSFENCRDVLIKLLYDEFKNYYIFEDCMYNINSFLSIGELNDGTKDNFDELYKGESFYSYNRHKEVSDFFNMYPELAGLPGLPNSKESK